MVGSVYGCMTGVDCYSNDRCLRQQPEYVDGYFYEDIGMLPILLIFATGILCCCFASLAFCCVAGVKGAYVNLVDAAVSTAQTREPDAQTQQSFLSEHLVQAIEQQEQPNVELVRTEAVNIIEETDIDDTEPVAEQAALLATNPSQEGYSLIVDRSSRITITSMVSPRPSAYAVSHSRRSGMGRMYCLYNLCRFCYVITLIGIGFFLFGSIRYYPKIPLYNVCNDAVAWKSIVDSMTNFKVEANFEILVSVLNNNNLDLAVDKGQGSFKHNGEFVGTFEIPPTVADSMAITDILVVATFTPEKWEALSLSKEYYAGTLSFDLDAEATFRVPALLDFTYNAAFENIHVMVNDPKLDDKHLCKCQK